MALVRPSATGLVLQVWCGLELWPSGHMSHVLKTTGLVLQLDWVGLVMGLQEINTSMGRGSGAV